jgi:hypothetical protein
MDIGRITFPQLAPDARARLDSDSGSVSTRVSELVERRSPFAQSQFLSVTPSATTFEVAHTLRPGAEDRIYAQLASAEGDVRIWRDPSDPTRPGLIALRCSTAGIPLVLLLFIPRP